MAMETAGSVLTETGQGWVVRVGLCPLNIGNRFLGGLGLRGLLVCPRWGEVDLGGDIALDFMSGL